MEADSKEMSSSFCDTFNLTGLIKEPASYKNLDNPSCIDVILTKTSQFSKLMRSWDWTIQFSSGDTYSH